MSVSENKLLGVRLPGNLSIRFSYSLPGEHKYSNGISSVRFGRDEARTRKCKRLSQKKGGGGG